MAETYSFVDDVPEQGNPVPSGLPTCVVCGADIDWAGRGRKPKYCPEHKPSRGASAASGKGSSAVVERAVNELSVFYGVIGQGIKFRNPPVGETVFQSRDKLAESWRMMLETNARFRKLFMKLESSAAIIPVLAAHGELIMAIYVQQQMAGVPVQSDSDSGNV